MFAQSNVLVGYATAEDSAYLNWCALLMPGQS